MTRKVLERLMVGPVFAPSRMPLAHYIYELRKLGFKIDTRMVRDHDEQFGIYELQGNVETRESFLTA